MNLQIPKNQYLRIKVIPKSAKNELYDVIPAQAGIQGATYKIRIKAVAEKGKANAELIKFLSKELEVPKENISILSGKTDHLKLIKIKYNL